MMLTFVSRQEILEKNKVLARHVYDWQQATYDPQADCYEAGQSVWLESDDEQATVLTDEMADQLNQEFEQYCRSMKDDFAVPPPQTSYTGCVIAELSSGTFLSFTEMIGDKLMDLFQVMEFSDVLAISDACVPYLEQDNDYEPVAQAKKQLISMGFKRDYSGGVIIGRDGIQEFFSSIFWIVRCNASSPNILFAGEHSSLVGTLCKYGNIHFECYDHEEEIKLFKALEENGFSIAADGICEEKFSETGAIEGRRLDIQSLS